MAHNLTGVPLSKFEKISLKSAYLLGAAASAVFCLTSTAQAQQTASAAPVETITVTGTLIQGNVNIVSPLTVISSNLLAQEGRSTIEDALQNSNLANGPEVTNSWTANGNFAQGASGISLRGLTTDSTLVLFDGMRAAYYPLADDGLRNFVDLNTIPDDIVDRVEILRDGASSRYGADAIAGVINIITKKNFHGFSTHAEGGISSRGDAAEFRVSATAGFGDLDTDHVNTYISGFYYHSDPLPASSRPYPYNTYDWSKVCATSCGPNNIQNAIQPDGTFNLASSTAQMNFMVRPYAMNAGGTQLDLNTPLGPWQKETQNCGPGTSVSLNAAQQAGQYPASVCSYDYRNLYGEINPMITRVGFSAHTAFQLPDEWTGWAEGNFMQDTVAYQGDPPRFYGNAPTGIYYPRFSTSANYTGTPPPAVGSEVLFLPVYVCPERTGCATAADHTLNPQNPFASLGEAARVDGTDVTRRNFDQTRDRTYRLAAGLDGTLFGNVTADIGVTAMHVDLHEHAENYVYIQHLLDLINDGTYNFIDPTKNSAAVNNYLYPPVLNNLTSDEAQVQATATVPVWKLDGGDLTVAGGGSIAYEAVNGPSENPDFNGPTDRYFTLNAFGTSGHRDVYSAFFEINAPIEDWVTLNVSGREDSYSTGQNAFVPKFGVNVKPWDGLTLKGTYSEGFRAPSFAEANALPTTGYVGNTSKLFNDAYLAQYGCSVATFSTACPSYIRQGSYGLTTIASPNLKPEHSRSFVFDATYQPIDPLTLTVTYYNIRKSGVITNLDCSAGITGYYSGGAIPAGCGIVADSPDPAFLAAKPRIAFVNAPLVNADVVRTSGFDFGITYDSALDDVENWVGLADTLGSVHMNTSANATWIRELATVFPDGHVERYDGTLGNNNLTAGTGTPSWKGIWRTTFSTEMYDLTSTLNWTAGYNVSAMDQGNAYRDCGLDDGSVPCRINDYFTWDLNLQAHVSDDTTLYLTMLNVTDNLPPVDTIATYGITGYNVVVGGDGILGRYFKAGVKFDTN